MKTLAAVAAGDTVHRYLAGVVYQPMRVIKVENGIIYTKAPDTDIEGWEFDQRTGAEIDDRFDWGPPPKMTGSFITAEPWKRK